MTYEELKNEIRMDDIKYDPWGTAIGWQFDIADELFHVRGEGCPYHWEFQPGAGGAAQDDGYKTDMLKNIETDVLIQFGNLLHRFVRACDHAGKSY